MILYSGDKQYNVLELVTACFIPGVFSGKWYNGQKENQAIYIGNKHSLLVGMARLRQLRVKASRCFFHFYYFLHLSEKAI